MVKERKVAQMAAYLLDKQAGRMPHLKLMKLLYLTDRESMQRYGNVVSGDRVVAMKHGPVLSMTLNYINGYVRSEENGWESWISDRENHEVSLRRDVNRETLDELSDADIEILDTIWEQFGHMDQWQIRDYTHDHCPEWEDPGDTSIPIPYHKIFEALGKSREEAKALAEDLEAQRDLDRLLNSI